MADQNRDPAKENHSSESGSNSNWQPASFEKRAAAWMAVVYMFLLMGILWFSLYHPGGSLQGTFPLLLLPVCIALAVVIIHRLKLKSAVGGPVVGVLVLLLCIAGVGVGLWMGLPALLAAFAG